MGPITKAKLTAALLDGISHTDEHTKMIAIHADEKVTWWAGTPPGYLEPKQYLAEVELAFAKWSAASSVDFEHVSTPQEAVIRLVFSNDEKFSDGTGGRLAEAHKFGIRFDASERWLLQGQAGAHVLEQNIPPPKKKGEFAFLPVLVHELGHILGLGHSFNEKDVM